MLNQEIDRDSYEPVYMQIVKILKKAISAGYFKPGDKLPSESQLCQEFSVSPMTVRRALDVLIEQNIIYGIQGKGTYIRKIKIGSANFELTALKKFFSSNQIKVKLLAVGVEDADKKTAEKLNINPGDSVIYLKRLLLKNSLPYFLHEEFLLYDPTRPIVESELEVTSLEGFFDGTGSSEIMNGFLKLKSVIFSSDQAEYLNLKAGTPGFNLEHIFYDYKDQPINWGKFYCSDNKLDLQTHIGIKDDNQELGADFSAAENR
ncbi:MAG: GntR family transcriptional regulator [Bacillota bacterium]